MRTRRVIAVPPGYADWLTEIKARVAAITAELSLRLRLRQVPTPRLAEFDQRLDANEAPLVIFQPLGHFLALSNERIDSFAEQKDVLAVFDDLAKETHVGTCGVN